MATQDTDRPFPHAGILAIAALFSVVLVAIPAWTHRGVVERLDALVRGEGELLIEAIRLLSDEGPPSQQGIDTALDALEDHGLVWIAIIDPPRREPVYAAGTPVAPPEHLPHPGEDFIVFDSTARLASGPARPPRPHAGGSPDPPVLIIEYIPEQALDLRRQSQVSLVASAIGSLLLFLAAMWLWRMSRQSAAQERAMARQAHLASLGQVSAVMAHEIRNPLAALKGHAQLLETRVADVHRARAHRVVDGAVRLEFLVDSLLEFARSAELAREPVDVSAFVTGIAREIADDRVVTDISEAPPSWRLDPTRLRQALLNIIGNALQTDSGPVSVNVSEAAGQLSITVRDHGPGVADPDRVFEPFFTTKSQGTGLGLAIARRIVTLHEGTIEVDNPPDGGAEFRIRLPRCT